MQDLLEQCLASPLHGWSMGSFGAIGEFNWDQGELCQQPADGRLGCITPRGALVVQQLDLLKLVAYEYLSEDPCMWVQGMVFCLPESEAQMNNYKGITELGPDKQALKAEHRSQLLFDLGLQLGFVDVAIRTDDLALMKVLRKAEGRNLLALDNPAMKAIINASPHRVFTTAMGRLEVHQGIGIDKSPSGPHTHVLPKLLARGLSASTNVPVPAGFVPVLSLHPAHPCKDRKGLRKQFDWSQHRMFQRCLQQYGHDGFLAQKQATFAALKQGKAPENFNQGSSRLLRAATRIALRQYACIGGASCGVLDDWLTAFDRKLVKIKGNTI